jgi:hypothetical protein
MVYYTDLASISYGEGLHAQTDPEEGESGRPDQIECEPNVLRS